MDLTNLKMAQGEPQWASKYNGLVDAVQNVEGVTDALKWTDFTDNGIVVISDYFRLGTDSGYSYLDIGGKRLVHLYLDIYATKDFTGSMTGFAVTLPDTIAPRSPMNGTANEKYEWTYGGKLGFIAFDNNTSTNMNTGDQFVVDKTYVMDL